jgi:hypothetical protein
MKMLRLIVPTLLILSLSASGTAAADSAGMNMHGMHAMEAMSSSGEHVAGMDMKAMRSTDSMHASGQAKNSGSMGGMKMPMSDEPAHFKPAAQAFTANHAFLVKLVSLPDSIPFQKHFSMMLAVFDGKHTDQKVSDAAVQVAAGMRHGMKNGFAHGMQSSLRVESKDGTVTISGLSFHMMGKWTLQIDVQQGGRKGTAYLDLPCCEDMKG